MGKKKRKFRGSPGQGFGGHVVQRSEAAIEINFGEVLRRWKPVDCSELIEKIEAKRGTHVVCLVYNNEAPAPCILTPPLLEPLRKVVSSLGRVPKIDLFLRSTGGIAEVPWRIVTILREFCDELGVIVSHLALSGGTHIAIAADDLVLTPFSLLGSVDPTRKHPLLPQDAKGNSIPTSVQDLKHCIQFIREQLGESYLKQNLALVVSELFKYVNPLAIGALEQSYALSRLITEKVLKTRKAPPSEEVIKKVQDMLGGGYFSHSFPISRADVESDLGLRVNRPDRELLDLIYALDEHYNSEFTKSVPAIPGRSQPIFKVGAFIQSKASGFTVAQLLKDNQVLADKWLDLPREEVPHEN